jgi:hypothetical protein
MSQYVDNAIIMLKKLKNLGHCPVNSLREKCQISGKGSSYPVKPYLLHRKGKPLYKAGSLGDLLSRLKEFQDIGLCENRKFNCFVKRAGHRGAFRNRREVFNVIVGEKIINISFLEKNNAEKKLSYLKQQGICLP